MRRQASQALPARARRALRESRRRPSSRFIAFLGEVSSRFHGSFRLLFAFPRAQPAIFMAHRRRFFLGRAAAHRSSGSLVVPSSAREIQFSQLLTLPPPPHLSSLFLPSRGSISSHNIICNSFFSLLSFFLPLLLPFCWLRDKEMSLRDLSFSVSLSFFLSSSLSSQSRLFYCTHRTKSNPFIGTLRKHSRW